jgi:hypothetical protein
MVTTTPRQKNREVGSLEPAELWAEHFQSRTKTQLMCAHGEAEVTTLTHVVLRGQNSFCKGRVWTTH